MAQDQDRRRGQRHAAYLAARISIEDRAPNLAVIKDVSENGLLLLTHAKLADGQSVKLHIHRPGDEDNPIELEGQVVRREPFLPDEIGTWSEKVAFRFDSPQPDLAQEFAALAERQARLLAPRGTE